MSYAYDPELVVLAAALPRPDLTDIPAARDRLHAVLDLIPRPELPADVTIREVSVPGPTDGPQVTVRVYTPTGRQGPLPALLHIHGGGFVVGDLDISHNQCAGNAGDLGAVVVAVDYRLAPEHPFPAAVEDCYAALRWMASRARELGIDLARIAVAGESAGGGLAAAVALLARDRGGPTLCAQILEVPELDDRLDTPSMAAYLDTPMWNRPLAELSWKYYLGGSAIALSAGDQIQYAAPARAKDLSGLPPAYVSVCEFDPLRDEGLIYAQRLLQAGVSVELHCYPGTFHGSTIAQDAAVSKRMMADHRHALRRGLQLHHLD